MSLFNIFVTQQKNHTKNLSKRFDYNFNLENTIPKIKTVKYSQSTSLVLYLKNLGLNNKSIDLIMCSTEMQNDFIKSIEELNKDMTIRIYKNANLAEKLIQFNIIIREYNNMIKLFADRIVYDIMIYYGIVELLNNSKHEYFKPIIDKLINHPNNIESYIKIFTNDLASCFAIFHLNTGYPLVEICKSIFHFIENNEYFQDVISIIPIHILQNIIQTNLKSIYTNHKLSITYLLKNDEKIDTKNFENVIFDIRKMQQVKEDGNYYYLAEEYKNKCSSDLYSLNEYINKVSNLFNVSLTLIETKKVKFEPSSYGCAKVKFSPLTRTGKASKYPYELSFMTYDKKAGEYGFDYDIEVIGTIYYFADGTIGKSEFTTWQSGQGITISLIIKNNALTLNRVFTMDEEGQRIVIYKDGEPLSNMSCNLNRLLA